MTSHDELPRSADLPHPRRWLLHAARPVVRLYTNRRYGVRVHHAERVPATGPVILAATYTLAKSWVAEGPQPGDANVGGA